MKTLVIGAAGFVGYYLIKELLNRPNNQVFATKLEHEKIDVDCNIINLDILNYTDVSNAIEDIKPDEIYHLAAQSSVALSWQKPQLTTSININGTINILEAIKEKSPNTKILLIGSSEEYGKIDYSKPVNEETTLNPQNIYAISKMTSEYIGKLYHNAYNLNIYMTRSFNHFGPRQAENFVISDFCNQVVRIEKNIQEPIIKVGNLESYRDFTDVRDVVNAYTTILNKGKSGQIYNVGSGKSIKIKDVLELIIKKSSKKIEIKIDDSKFRPIDILRVDVNNSKLTDLGWKPKYKLENTIDDILTHLRNK